MTVKDELNSRIDDVEYNVTNLINDKFNHLTPAASQNLKPDEHKPVYEEHRPAPKKRVKSAARRPQNNGKKLEEMRRWLEYQRKFTAEEIKKRTEHFKDQQEQMHPKIDTSYERDGSRSELKRVNYDQVSFS